MGAGALPHGRANGDGGKLWFATQLGLAGGTGSPTSPLWKGHTGHTLWHPRTGESPAQSWDDRT